MTTTDIAPYTSNNAPGNPPAADAPAEILHQYYSVPNFDEAVRRIRNQHVQILDLRPRVDQLQARLTEVTIERDRLIEDLRDTIGERDSHHEVTRALRAELTRFRVKVRDTAIRVAAENGWCDDGLNDVLNELDLEPKAPPVRTYAVEVVLTATQTVIAHVEAVDAAAAAAEVESDPGIAWDAACDGHWDGNPAAGGREHIRGAHPVTAR